MSFLDELQKNTNKTRTENGAVTNLSTLDPLLDFFSMAGAMRNNPNDALKLFNRAYASDKQVAIRTLFYLRDIRGGQGERNLFRTIMTDVQRNDLGVYTKAIKFVPKYGRWDDLFAVSVDEKVAELVKAQLTQDEQAMSENKTVSLLAKWMPSTNTTSKATRMKAEKLAKLMGLKPAQYRKRISALRKYIRLLEQQMSARQWPEIEYGKVPSQAHRKHVKAFKRHDEERYTTYLGAVEKGEAKINTKTLYTYEVFDMVQNGDTDSANAMWANLPDYTNGKDAIVVADVSGSMSGRPMSVSVSLALYFAEHNKGIMKNYFMTFSAQPQLIKVVGNTLDQKLRMIENAHWDQNTNLEAVFDVLLQSAQGTNGDGLPKIIYIISDMEFDQAISNPNESIFDNAKAKWQAASLELPHVVFWNVNAHQQQAPATKFDNHVTLISGLSQSTFRYAVEGKTPIELMHEVINSERYARIVL